MQSQYTPELKLCRGCDRHLDRVEFTKNSRAPDGLEWRCRSCYREIAQRYYLTDRARSRKLAWNRAHREETNARRRQKRAARDPMKDRARTLIGMAVRRGWIAPPGRGNWSQGWEFHHPDHRRPYYGIWVRKSEHEAIEHGFVECPPCVDYSDHIRRKALEMWGLPS